MNTNLPSLIAQRHLEGSSAARDTAFERLSSGLRINHGSDDPAGLAVADSLQRNIRIAAQAVRNANDALSALTIAEKALGNVTDLLTRLSELASEAATGTLTGEQRSAIQEEFAALVSEIGRISATTAFNGILLLSGGATIAVQVGLDGTADSQIAFSTVDGSVSGLLGVSQTALAASSADAAQSALGVLASAVANVAQLRGNLGAYESRLLTALANLRVARENFTTAEARIRDADVAAETAALARARILEETGSAVLALANLQPGVVLALLRLDHTSRYDTSVDVS